MSFSSQMHRTTSRSDVKRALIVEDNADSASVLSKLLETLGYIVEIARNGTEALTVAASFAPEVVLIDIGLPGLDGWQVARELRRSGGEKTLLIAVTGLWVEKDRFQSKEAGFDHYFMKPLDLEALKSLLVTA
jgi:two-component system, OmpR family, response regulator